MLSPLLDHDVIRTVEGLSHVVTSAHDVRRTGDGLSHIVTSAHDVRRTGDGLSHVVTSAHDVRRTGDGLSRVVTSAHDVRRTGDRLSLLSRATVHEERHAMVAWPVLFIAMHTFYTVSDLPQNYHTLRVIEV